MWRSKGLVDFVFGLCGLSKKKTRGKCEGLSDLLIHGLCGQGGSLKS